MKVNQDFTVNANGTLNFNAEIIHPEADVRKLSDAKNVLFQDIPLTDEPIYFMYRDVHQAKDEANIRKSGIRYDITVILPGTLGQEYIKTVGHFHPAKPGTTDTYPEYYEVLDGHALYILQKNEQDDLAEFIAVDAKSGDKVYIPQNYGHITVNIGDRPLVMANLIEATFKSDYKPFVDKKGAAYYVVEGSEKQPELVFNNHYKNNVTPDKQLAVNRDQATPLVADKTLYEALVANPNGFEFLK